MIFVDENNNVVGVGSRSAPSIPQGISILGQIPTDQPINLVPEEKAETGEDVDFDKDALIDENPAYNYAVNVADDDEQLYQTHKQELSDKVRLSRDIVRERLSGS